MNDFLDRHDRMKRLNRCTYVAYNEEVKLSSGVFLILVTIIIGCFVGTVLSMRGVFKSVDQLNCSTCHNPQFYVSPKQVKMTEYFKKKGNPTPEVMAKAVLKTSKPRLLAAMAVRGEKNTPHWIRNGGYKKRHAGAWQVNPRDWGAVPYDVTEQALQAELVVDKFIKAKGGIVNGLNAYGGDKTKKVYAQNILNELQEVPK
jgi:hypothetical protein